MKEAPKVYCPQEKKKVPIWYCLGSFVQKRNPCPYANTVTVKVAEDFAEVECSFKGSKKNERK